MARERGLLPKWSRLGAMRIVNVNLNGIRAATTKGITRWIKKENADVVCLQEIRAHEKDIAPVWRKLGYECFFHSAEKPGYAGVALLSRVPPASISFNFDKQFDREGRVITAEFEKVKILSAYFPSGTTGDVRQREKMKFLKKFLPYVCDLAKGPKEVLFCGDINIAHKNIDLKNWRSNQKHSGFLPEERKWIDKLLTCGFEDVFRNVVGPDAEIYSWWSNFGNARANDVGWRIDYQFATPKLAKKATKASIYRKKFFSDHAPVTIDYDFVLK